MDKLKRNLSQDSGYSLRLEGDLLVLAPSGKMDAAIVASLLEDLRGRAAERRQQGLPVLILIDISGITGHDSEARVMAKQGAKLDFDRGAAYGGKFGFGLVMQYLQRSIDPERARYFSSRAQAVSWLMGDNNGVLKRLHANAVYFVALSCLLLGLIMLVTYGGYTYARQEIHDESEQHFEIQIDKMSQAAQRRMQVYDQTLNGFRGLFYASDQVDRDEFRAYYRGLQLDKNYPGLSAVSFIKIIKDSQKIDYINTVQKDRSINSIGYPKFSITPEGKRTTYAPITYSEPTGDGSLGYDLYSNPERYDTLQRAQSTGTFAASPTLELMNDDHKGFLVALPVYDSIKTPEATDRQGHTLGYVNAVFRYQQLLDDIFPAHKEVPVQLQITDAQGVEIYKTKSDIKGELHNSTRAFALHGQALRVNFSASKTYAITDFERRLPILVLGVGTIISAFLVVLLLSFIRSRNHAVELADTMTEDLAVERNRAVANQTKLEKAEQALLAEKASVEHKVQERTEELHEIHAQLTSSIKNLPFGLAILGQDDSIVFTNQMMPKLIGDNGQMATLKDISKYFGDSFDVAGQLQHVKESKRATEQTITIGSKFLKVAIVPVIEQAATSVIGAVIILDDITEAKIMERSRDEFFSIASHELRTPLTVIQGNASMMTTLYPEITKNAELDQMAEDIKNASERLITVVSTFLDMTELEQGRLKVEAKPFLVNEAVADAFAQVQKRAEAQNIDLVYDRPKQLVSVMADKRRTVQVLYSLLDNAINATEKGKITVKVEVTSDTLVMTVKDSGKGIELALQNLLFHKLQQASKDILTRDSTRGTGLSLYVSRLLAEAMHGRLYLVESRPNKGSSFCLELPVA